MKPKPPKPYPKARFVYIATCKCECTTWYKVGFSADVLNSRRINCNTFNPMTINFPIRAQVEYPSRLEAQIKRQYRHRLCDPSGRGDWLRLTLDEFEEVKIWIERARRSWAAKQGWTRRNQP